MAFTTSLNGIANAQTELNVTANNLANAQTTGFKSSSVNFADLVSGSAYTNPKLIQGVGSRVKSIDQDFTNGSIESTGASTDVAVNGEGFFTVKNTASGQMLYTRNGNFSLDANGYMVDASGNQVQGFAITNGTTATTPSSIQAPTTDSAGGTFTAVQINSNGEIVASYSDGTTNTVGQFALASFVSPTGLRQLGTQDWSATGLSGAATYNAPSVAGMGTVLSGSLEESNVDVSTQLVDLIQAQQYFQANSKAISTNDQMITSILQVQG